MCLYLCLIFGLAHRSQSIGKPWGFFQSSSKFSDQDHRKFFKVFKSTTMNYLFWGRSSLNVRKFHLQKQLKPAKALTTFLLRRGSGRWKKRRESLLSVCTASQEGREGSSAHPGWPQGDFDSSVASLLQLAIQKVRRDKSVPDLSGRSSFFWISLNCNGIIKDSLKGTTHLVWDLGGIGGDGGGSKENLQLFTFVN